MEVQNRNPGLSRIAMATLASLTALFTVRADPSVTGGLQFTGSWAWNNSLQNATAFTNFSVQIAPGTETGIFTNLLGKESSISVSCTAFSFNPRPSSPFQVMTFTADSITYSFEVDDLAIAYQDPVFLDVGGQVTANVTGYAPTIGEIQFAAANANPQYFYLSYYTLEPVPEPKPFWLFAGAGLLSGVGTLAKRARSNS